VLKLSKLIINCITGVTLALVIAPNALAQKASGAAKDTEVSSKSAASLHSQTLETTSPCQSLAVKDCRDKKECNWIIPKKKVDKRGRNLKSYCHKAARRKKIKLNDERTAKVTKRAVIQTQSSSTNP